MTDTPDLSPAALEALAERLTSASTRAAEISCTAGCNTLTVCACATIDDLRDVLSEAAATLRALAAATQWRPIETAPKGGGAELKTDPEWVEPPVIMLAFPDGDVAMARWEWYYAEHGFGWDGRNAWVIHPSFERVADYHFADPTGWLPLPTPPRSERSEG